MSHRSRIVAFAALCLLLAGSAAALIALGPSQTPPPPVGTTSAAPSRPSFEDLEHSAERRQEQAEPRILRDGVAEHEEEPTPPAIYERTRRVAEPVARRFFAAYSLYEIGKSSGAVRRNLTATAAPDFAEELLSAPPRVPAGAGRPSRAQLGRLQLVPGAQEAPQAELTSIELVGEVKRAGQGSELLAISLELDRNRWSVTGLGR